MIRTSPLDFRQLAQFVSVMQGGSMAQAAMALGIAKSTLSGSLSALERALGLKLFGRRGSHLVPLPAATWLFRHALAVLQAEEDARAAVGGVPVELVYDIDFAIGPAASAALHARHALAAGGLMVGVQFDGAVDDEPTTRVTLRHGPAKAGWIAVRTDPWIRIGGSPGGRLLLPALRPALLEDFRQYADRQRIAERMVPSDLDAEEAQRTGRADGVGIVLPASLVVAPLGAAAPAPVPLDPPLASTIVATIEGSRSLGMRVVDAVRLALAAPPSPARFAPQLTVRQFAYFSEAHRLGGITRAAAALHVSQAALSSQLSELEAQLGGRLFDRTSGGVTPTELGHRLHPLATAIAAGLDRIRGERLGLAAQTQDAIALGMLPSSGHDSAMTGTIAAALTAFRADNPGIRLRVVEGANAWLHEQVRVGELNLAIAGGIESQVSRIPLGSTEPLSLIANPELWPAMGATASLAQIAEMPLVIGPRHLSIHRMFLDAAQRLGLRPNIAAEVGSLPLAIALVRRGRLATILPASTVRQDLQSGTLIAATISDPLESRGLFALFSAERELSEPERALIRRLAQEFERHTVR
ncbi:MAG: LysR family transcriptional regulator [Devosia sp.]